MRTQVGIVGAGPAGLFLSLLLQRAGIDCVVLESHSREYVESRVRAGVLEQGTVDLMADLGVDGRLRRECMIDKALDIRFAGRIVHIDLPTLTDGKLVHIYGQQEVVKDLIAARLAASGALWFDAEATRIDGLTSDKPTIHFRRDGKDETLTCDIVAGCDGFHGVCRPAIPAERLTTYDREFPFSWLGILSESPPLHEMTYANHDRGFALASRRSPKVARLYLQCAPDEELANWSDARIWDELHVRLGDPGKTELHEGKIFQRNIAPVRSFVSAPMNYGRMFLAGDASHIVPPTGAKGLNLAVADVRILSRALIDFFRGGATERLDRYSETCLRRIWKVVRFSTFMTMLLHRPTGQTNFDREIQLAELDYIAQSRAAATTIAENYVGLPFEDD
jgi:p-hydroxybenzoate 3-monooxygenase